jgi:DNA-binding transcriptional ArsR family regulator
MSPVLNRMEARIEGIEREIAALGPLVLERARLLRARAAILGEPEPVFTTPSLRPRVTRDAVFEYLTRNPGSRAGEIARGLGVSQGAVSAHLYRGKARLFASRGGRWFPVPEGERGAI